jgi:tRNA-splicing ligase RtcB
MSITSFGPADERSERQLERCIAVSGEDAAGVLCADHHLGYGMPIGGSRSSWRSQCRGW